MPPKVERMNIRSLRNNLKSAHRRDSSSVSVERVPRKNSANASNTTIFHLNIDCFLLIARHFTFVEKVRLERVCKWFKRMLALSYNIVNVNIAEFIGYTREHIYVEQHVLGILTRVAPFVRSVSFGARLMKVTDDVAAALRR